MNTKALEQKAFQQGLQAAIAAILGDTSMIQDMSNPNDFGFHMWERGQLDACAAVRKLCVSDQD